jgi:hypothetical protein
MLRAYSPSTTSIPEHTNVHLFFTKKLEFEFRLYVLEVPIFIK